MIKDKIIPSCYILLHGAWHASWCWKYLVNELKDKGHDVIAPDLPGHGQNMQSFLEINLDTYLSYLSEIIMSCDRQIILVGHSMAGIIISQLAENMPEKIAQLIYVAAFIPENKTSLMHEAEKSRSQNIASEMLINTDRNEIELKKSNDLIDLFYNRCQREDAEFALQHLQKEPFQPFLDRINISVEKFGSVKARYIECSEDKVLLLKDQRRMQRRISGDVISLNCDHSPFFSDPAGLCQAILCHAD
jgi:pimeloyl-ACP methyl ester carboxylesterase